MKNDLKRIVYESITMCKILFPSDHGVIEVHDLQWIVQKSQYQNIVIHYDVFVSIDFFEIFQNVKYLRIDHCPPIALKMKLPESLIYFEANVILYDDEMTHCSSLQALMVNKLYVSSQTSLPSSLLIFKGKLALIRIHPGEIKTMLYTNSRGVIERNDQFNDEEISCHVIMKRQLGHEKFSTLKLNDSTYEILMLTYLYGHFNFIHKSSIRHLHLEHTIEYVDYFSNTLIKLRMNACTKLPILPHDLEKLYLPVFNQKLIVKLPNTLKVLHLHSFEHEFSHLPQHMKELVLPRCTQFSAHIHHQLKRLILRTYPEYIPDHVHTLKSFSQDIQSLFGPIHHALS